MAYIDFSRRFSELYSRLRRSYAEPHRVYHDWAHIESLLAQLKRLQAQCVCREAMDLAIHYHDVIYDPPSKTNERDSAARMADELTGAVAPAVLADAVTLVLATEKHLVPEVIRPELVADCGLFLDMDLSVLGSPPGDFDSYEHAIREECAAVPDDLYNSGRRTILERFLARPAIYFSDVFRNSHEDRARENLVYALSRL